MTQVLTPFMNCFDGPVGDIIPPDTYYHQIVVESDLRDGCATQIYTPPCTCWNVVVDYDVNRIYITSWNRAIARIQLLKAVTLN